MEAIMISVKVFNDIVTKIKDTIDKADNTPFLASQAQIDNFITAYTKLVSAWNQKNLSW